MRGQLLPFQGPRLVIVRITVFVLLLVLLLRLYEWQFPRYGELQAGAEENAIQNLPLAAPRGIIYDRYNTGLAFNAPAFNVGVVPAQLPEDEEKALEVLNRLSALIDVPATRASADAAGKKNIRSLQELVKEGEGIAPYRAVVVKTDVAQPIAQSILEDRQNLPGVEVGVPVSVRQYPTGTTTAQLIGYLGPIGEQEANKLREQGYNPAFERVGYAGVEAFLDDDLGGKRGLLTQVVDVAGLPIRVIKRDEPQAGRNVRLTIDLDLQKNAERALVDQLNRINTDPKNTRTRSQSGVVIAMNPKTGEILAMVSWPVYDNSRFARSIDADYYFRVLEAPFDPLTNHAIGSLYPPGSVWKLVTAAAVMQERVIDPKSFLVDKGELFVENSFAKNDPGSRQRFVCWLRQGHGNVDMIAAIAWSCDVYFYQVGGGNAEVSAVTLRAGGLGIDDLDRYATMFGIGTKLGVELPGEVAGKMPDPTWKRRVYGESWSTGDTYNAAFGQGYVTVTPLQLLVASSAIANGGTVYQPTVINSWVDSAGNVLQPFAPKVLRTIVPPPEGVLPVINPREDMYIQGKESMACVCDLNSVFNTPGTPEYDPTHNKRCTEEFKRSYRATVKLTMDTYPATMRGKEIEYTVQPPLGYSFRNLCDPLQFKPDYQPPFVDQANISIVQQGMRGAVVTLGGTALKGMAPLSYIPVAGKTGTAEYCDDIANKQNLCLPGAWPSHAWFVGYAPYDNPEIIAIAFIYNAGDGSASALPIVRNVLDCYFKLKTQREANLGLPLAPCPIDTRNYLKDGE